MKRLILHWSAGAYEPSAHDKRCYHFLVDKNGTVHNGIFKPEDNKICRTDKYAAHTGGGNTGSIGVAMCAMAGFRDRDRVGAYPITLEQFESTMKLCAQLCEQYAIEISPDTTMTHYEFGLKNPKSTSAGKIDIIYIPPYPWVAQTQTGSFIRTKIKWYKEKLHEKRKEKNGNKHTPD